MKKKSNVFINRYLLIAVFAVLTSSCEKEEDVKVNNSPQTFTDSRDGNVYKYIKIGNQLWMAENLKYLPSVSEAGMISVEIPCYNVYGYSGTSLAGAKASFNYGAYGVLYNWAAAKTACPAGWHLPTIEEWNQLADYLGGKSVAGIKLKETGTGHWQTTSTDVTNETGFTALPGGFRNFDGTFKSSGYRGYWWSATEGDETYSAYHIHLSYNAGGMGMESFANSKAGGLSVRCVKD
jgi:uncharacterized protein (TIGR02145 family)